MDFQGTGKTSVAKDFLTIAVTNSSEKINPNLRTVKDRSSGQNSEGITAIMKSLRSEKKKL